MKIFITGASGLVGSEIAARFEFSQAHEHRDALRISQIIKSCLSERKGFIALDLLRDEDFDKIARQDFDLIIHSAAWRDPDRCVRNKEIAYKINYLATKKLAKIAKDKNAFMFYISTDYVFSGQKAPYSEDDIALPVNYYGETKLLGEKVVSEICKESAILRIPLQYGLRAGLKQCPMLVTSIKALLSGNEWFMEDSIVRYPTYSGDVADAVFFIVSKGLNGIYHLSGQDKTSRYKLTLDIADLLGLDSSKIRRLDHPPTGEEARPLDSHLSMKKLVENGFPPLVPFKKRIELLKNEILSQINELK